MTMVSRTAWRRRVGGPEGSKVAGGNNAQFPLAFRGVRLLGGGAASRESVTTLLNCCRSVFFSYTTTTMFKKESVGHFLHFQIL